MALTKEEKAIQQYIGCGCLYIFLSYPLNWLFIAYVLKPAIPDESAGAWQAAFVMSPIALPVELIMGAGHLVIKFLIWVSGF